MNESQIEAYLRDEVKKRGGRAYKFISPGNSGVPDRIVVFPGLSPRFVELKTETGRLSKVQRAQIKKLRDMGQSVWVLYGREDVDRFLLEMGELKEMKRSGI